jgi:hypothetical protein
MSELNWIPGSRPGSHRRKMPSDAGRHCRTIHAARRHTRRYRATSRDGSEVFPNSGPRAPILPGALTGWSDFAGLASTPHNGAAPAQAGVPSGVTGAIMRAKRKTRAWSWQLGPAG